MEEGVSNHYRPLILVQAAGFRRPIRQTWWVGLPFGTALGILYSVTTISGPPLAMLFNNQGLVKTEFRAGLALVRVAESSVTAIVYYQLGLFTAESGNILWVLVPCVAVGVPLGAYVIRHLDAETFRRMCMSFDAWVVGFGFSRVSLATPLRFAGNMRGSRSAVDGCNFGGTVVFAPKVAGAQTKVAEVALHRSTRVEQSGDDPLKQALFLKRAVENQATLRLLAQGTSSPIGNKPGDNHEQEAGRDNATALEEAPRAFSWDFTKIPLFPSDKVNRPQERSSLSPPPLPGAIQPKLTIGDVNDPLEHEADRVADQVIRMPNPGPYITDAPPQISRKRDACSATGEVSASVHEVLSSPGHPLDTETRAYFEPRFRYDFSNVRVHTNADAGRSARELSARAYTVGQHIAFAPGEFAPATQDGQKLIAHELAHVAQQSRANNRIQRQPVDAAPTEPAFKMMRLYSFGPTGAGRMQMHSGMTIFPPPAPVDAKTNELVRAGSPEQPIRVRFGRAFQLDERHRPYPPPIPRCHVRAVADWKPDDGSASTTTTEADDAPTYYGPGVDLGTKLGTEEHLFNDRPGVLTHAYVFTVEGAPFLLLGHGVHFVDDRTAPIGATSPIEATKGKGGAAAPLAPEKTPVAPSKPETKGTPLPSPPPAHTAPPEVVGEIKALTDLIKKTTDAIQKDALVKKLRDLLSRIQPFMPRQDAQKAIDDAIQSLVKDGAHQAILAILEAVTGKSPTTMPEDRNQTGPNVPQKDVGEKVVKGPKIPWKDAPKLPPRLTFDYRNGLQTSYAAGAPIKFTVVPPENFSELPGGKRLVIVAEADRQTPNPERFGSVVLDSASPKSIELTAPTQPGKYVIRVDVGLGFDYSSVRLFEVTEKK
jgi:hypothetical protein